MARQHAGAEHRHAALPFDLAHRYLRGFRRRDFDRPNQIVETVESDDEIDARDLRHFLRIHLRITAGNQHLRRGIQPFGSAHQLARFRVRTVRHRAGVDYVALRRFLEGYERMLPLQAALNHRRIVLIDFAAECGNRNPHLSSLRSESQISDLRSINFELDLKSEI